MDKRSIREGYGSGLLKAGRKDDNVVSLEADLGASCKTSAFRKEFPHRAFNLGISEQDMVCTAAGLANEGKVAFAATFAIFLERAFEQVRNSVARQNLNVKLLGSHAGIHTGEDGSSAQAIEDIAIYRALPNMSIVVPADAVEAEQATLAAAQLPGPFYLRVTRNKTAVVYPDGCQFELGRGDVLRRGTAATLFACGTLVAEALAAATLLEGRGISLRVVNMSSLKPIDSDLIVACADETGLVFTAEDHTIIGGLGGAVAEVLSERRPTRLVRIGLDDRFGVSGDPDGLYRRFGLDAESLAERVERELES